LGKKATSGAKIEKEDAKCSKCKRKIAEEKTGIGTAEHILRGGSLRKMENAEKVKEKNRRRTGTRAGN